MKGTFTALAMAFALTATACGGGDKTSSAPASVSVPGIQTNNTNPKPRDQVQEGGTFTWPIDQMPPNFNYNQLDGTLNDTNHVIGGLLPVFYTTDARGVPVWNRDYLAAEPTIVTDPKQVVTFQINPKAIWYDGTPMTWEDLYYQWRANNGTNKAYIISAANGWEDIENIAKGKDEREAIVTFKRHFADWQSIFFYFVPASTTKDPKIFNEGWKDQPLSSAGPFRLGSIDKTAKTITMVRNEKWWGNPAKLEKIVYRVIEPDAQIDALANGEIDGMDIGSDANKYNRAKGIEGIDLRLTGGPNFGHITINGTGPILKDLEVRRALAMAVDRSAIARSLLGPLGIPVTTLNNHIFMANQDGYQDNSGDVGKYDPEKSKQLLDAAGWKMDGKVRKKDGKPLDLSFKIPAGVAVSKQIAELIQNMLGQVGINAVLEGVPMNDFFDKYISLGQFDLVIFSWIGTPYPISSSKSIYAKPTKDAKGQLAIQQNYARVGSDEIDQLFNQANGELDRKKAIELANKADALIWQEVHSLTTYQRPELNAVKRDLANFGAFGFQQPWVYQDIGWVKK